MDLSDIDKEMSNPVYLDKYLFGVFFCCNPKLDFRFNWAFTKLFFYKD